MRALPLRLILLTAGPIGCIGSETDDGNGDDAGTGAGQGRDIREVAA